MADSANVHAFPGGLALPHHKQVSLDTPLRSCPLPDRLFIPFDGHQNQLLVEPGETVRRGQPLTAASDDLQVPCHASSAGTLIGISPRPAIRPGAPAKPCIELLVDPLGPSATLNRLRDWQTASQDQLVDHLHQMGLAGMGGAMFSTPAKLRGPWSGINTLILNGAECEPWIACDESLMRTRPAEILIGGLILAAAAGAEHMIVAVEDPMDQTARDLSSAAAGLGLSDRVQITCVPCVYPQGGERQLIQCLTGLEVPHDGLPQDLGLLCHNVATAAAAFDAVESGKAVTERIVTVTGAGVAQPGNFVTPIGTPASWVIHQAGGYTGSAHRLVVGGPMSGISAGTDEFPISKGTNCLLVLDTPTSPGATVLPCINCGACVQSCPASLMPQTLFRLIKAGRYEQSRELGVFDCIECGCCAQVCPSYLPLVDSYRHAKAQLRLRDLDHRRAVLAKRRHEARQTRLAEEQAAREARRLARAERLREKKAASEEIQAAIARARRKKQSPTEN